MRWGEPWAPTLLLVCVLETHAVAHVKDLVSTYLNTGPHKDALGSFWALPQVPLTAVSWSQVPLGSRCRMNCFSFLSWYYPFCLARVFFTSTNNIPGLKEVRKWQGLARVGLNNFGICRPLRCSIPSRTSFWVPQSLLLPLSWWLCRRTSVVKPFPHIVLGCRWPWLTTAVSFPAHRCGSMASRKGERGFDVDWSLPSFLWQWFSASRKWPFHSGCLSDILHIRYLHYD